MTNLNVNLHNNKSKNKSMSKIFFKILAFLFFINLSFYVPTQKVEALACATCYTIRSEERRVGKEC